MPTSIYLLFDERMALHRPIGTTFDESRLFEHDAEMQGTEDFQFERPARVYAIYHALRALEEKFVPQQCFIPLECKPASKETICLAHSEEHYERLKATALLSDDELKAMQVENDLYFCRDTFLAATLACGGVVQCVNAVTDAFRSGVGSTRSIALVRPPGHHAEYDFPMGFCYFNNVAVAAKHAIHTGRARRVFILDWDIHHGNGIQHITYDDPNIFYLSIHRGDSVTGNFYPGTGEPAEVGQGNGIGTNLNIVWGKRGMGNVEYAAAFEELVLPALSTFNPDLIMIACGLDPARGDLLGDCGLTPDMFYIMTESLLEKVASDIPVVAVLEGGYNLEVMSTCMQAVALALLDEPYEEDIDTSLALLWTKAKLYKKLRKDSTRFIAIESIKESARALGKSRVSEPVAIPPRPSHVPAILFPPDLKARSHRLTIAESDRYPAKKQMRFRAGVIPKMSCIE